MKKIFTLLLLLSSFIGFSQSTTIVISQVYGAGGNSGAVLNADYVELHNISTVSQSINGMSIQYESATPSGTWGSTIALLPNASIPAGGYYLVQLSTASASNGAALPAVDFFANVALGGSNGIVALLVGTTVISGCPTSNVVDLVGYGTATCSEGNAPTDAISATLAAIRINNGCTDTNNNAADFTTGTPAPRNSASPVSTCGASTPASLIVTGSIAGFGNITVGNSSASQTYSLSGTDLTGAPGNITVTSPSADFEVSNNNTTWAGSTTIAYTAATLTATPVYVRFTPQSAGLKAGNISNNGGGIPLAVTVAVNGTGVASTAPTFSATALNAFGNVCVNTSAGPNSFTINGANLSNTNVAVGPLAGFTFATTAAGTYAPSLDLTQAGGTFTQTVFVQFTPTAIQSYAGSIPVSGAGATAINVAVTGAGSNNAPAVTSGAAGNITTSAATLTGTISDIGCSAVTAYGIEYSTTNNFPNGAGTQVASTNLAAGTYSSNLTALAPSTTYYYKAYATNAGGTTYGLQRSFVTASPVLVATPLTAFGALCVNATGGPNSFSISSTSLGTANVTVGALAGYTYSTTANGTYTNSLSITQPGGSFSQTVFVKFTPAALQSYNGNIAIAGGGANIINVAASGSGVNITASVTSVAATAVTTSTAYLAATIATQGCSFVTSQGFEYSGINNFTPGSGMKAVINAVDASGNYSTTLNSLVYGTTYYFRAYATSAAGTGYSAIQSFTTTTIPKGLTIYGIPAQRGTTVRFSIDSIKADHYAVVLLNSNGQQVFRKDMIVQTDFINESFIVPGSLTPGVYQFRLQNVNGFISKKNIMIK